MGTLMVSVSGIRGIVGDGLDPFVLVKYITAFAQLCGKGKIVIGRDGRISGGMVKDIVSGTLTAKGNDVTDLGICPTPTVLFNVKKSGAAGGISISASHNPNEWNALKLLNSRGEFLTREENDKLQEIIAGSREKFCRWNELGTYAEYPQGIMDHMDAVLNLPVFDINRIRKRRFRILLDCVNGAGSYVMPELLEQLSCDVIKINCDKSGIFPRKPEPLPENLTETINAVRQNDVDLGIVVDPDVDRLVLLQENGEPFGEENTIVQAVNFVLSKNPGNVVVNLSTTRAVDDIAGKYSCKVYRSPVGEANVVSKMKQVGAVIGGEGSGGVIYPELQYGRDALVGTLMILQQLAEYGKPISGLKNEIPQYYIVKKKLEIDDSFADEILSKLKDKYSSQRVNIDDGLRIDFDDHWVHFRKSNTEPIIRCMVESTSQEKADVYIRNYTGEIKQLMV